jgi:hypothetical protein
MPARNTAARLGPATGAGHPLQAMKCLAGSGFQHGNLAQIQQLQRTLELRQAFLAHMQVAGCSDLAAQLIMNITAAYHRLKLLLPVAGSQSAFDSALAVAQEFGVVSAHSKCHFHGCFECLNKPISTNVYRHFEFFRSGRKTKSRLLRV